MQQSASSRCLFSPTMSTATTTKALEMAPLQSTDCWWTFYESAVKLDEEEMATH